MTLEAILSSIAISATGYIIWLEKRMHKMQSEVDSKITSKEAEHLIDLKQSATDVRLADLKEDLKEIKQDLKDLKNKL